MDRLEKLELQVHVLTAMVLCSVTALAVKSASTPVQAAEAPGSITVKDVRIVDANGNLVAILNSMGLAMKKGSVIATLTPGELKFSDDANPECATLTRLALIVRKHEHGAGAIFNWTGIDQVKAQE